MCSPLTGRTVSTIALIVAFVIPHPLAAQRSEALLDFYRLEQQTWREYLEASKGLTTASAIDVTFYHIHIEPSLESPYLTGNVLCQFVALEQNTSAFTLNLRREFTVDSVRGDAASFVFEADTIRLLLDRTFQTGDTGSVRVYYRGVPPLINNTKGLRYTTHATAQRVIASLSTPFLAHSWWPCKDGPGDKPDSVAVDITIPDTSIGGIPVVAVSNGVLEETLRVGRKKTFRWRHRYPIVPYYVMAAISNYREFRQTFTGRLGEQFPIVYYVFEEHLAAAQEGVASLPQVMAAFSDCFGPYPFRAEKYGMTQLGYYGAIENQTNTIINNMGLSFFGVSVHELAHMWFGDMITCKDWHHGWLNEGFATYAEALWAEHTGGHDAYLNDVRTGEYYGPGTLYLQDITDPFGIFIPIIYNKGSMVLHMLRGVLGDSVFFRVLSTYAGTPALLYGHATTEDFQQVCETVSGMSLTFFFDQWVYDQYYPSYVYDWANNGVSGGVTVTIRQNQGGQGRRAVFEMPVRLKFHFQQGGDTTVTVWNNQQSQTYFLPLGHVAQAMEFDPERWILRSATVEGIVALSQEIPDRFALYQNFPNPFNPSTTVRYDIHEETHVMLAVFDLLGREVSVLVSGREEPGRYEVAFDAHELPSGVYLYRMSAGNFVHTRKMLLLQ